ncbi:MAG TPA: adenylate/guanylate cyclase domain-containing protein [Actinomycetota bacterium]|nr:adenylate/guanylate cyclase domain-containing protein [Actinomycetota bacterium]
MPRLLLQRLAGAPEETSWSVEGTVVFVDISGFTKLSERLSKHGREGAEQVTDAIEGCFSALLSVAYASGGGLIKFGGDALLLLFDGPGHVPRAARSAVWMRRLLRDVGRVELPGVKLQLRMSVGIHTGRFDMFLIGDSHRELLVTGPAWTRTVEMEHAAEAGEILVSPEVAALLPARCIGRDKVPGRLLVREPRDVPPPGDVSVDDLVPEETARCLSVAVREHVLAGGGAPEHRPVTVAFIHFDGTDELLRAEGPEVTALALQDLVETVQTAVDYHGVCFLGSDVDADGGKIILTAGAPTVSGNDEERMLLALRGIAETVMRIPIRIGVNRGAVFAGDIGPSYRRTYTVMGDAVNLAARLMAKAEPGQVYATADVLERSNTTFDTTELEPFMVKGKARPVGAWSVGQAIGSRSRLTASAKRFALIGRSEELGVLESALAGAHSGHGRLVEIVGEPGIGKTRLLEELRSRAEGFRALHATAEAYTSSTPYFVWRELLRELIEVGWEDPDDVVFERLYPIVEEANPDLLPWLPLLAGVLGVALPPTLEIETLAPEFIRPKIHEIVAEFLEMGLKGPTLIQVEDAHLMDEASSDLLASIVERLHDRPWLVAVTRRDTDTGFVAPDIEAVARLRPGPLSAEDALAFAQAATEDAPLLPHDLQMLAERSGGNPQFLLDLVQVLAIGSMLPESVEAAAMARIDQLPPADRSLLRRASVLGVSFHPRLLSVVLDEGVPEPTERTWEELGEFVEDDGEGHLRFRRAVVRDAAYEGLPFRTRRLLHAKVGQRLEEEADDADEAGGVLSLHLFLAGEYAKAWRYARRAAERAAAGFANQEAAHLYRRAIDAAKRLHDIGDGEIAAVYEAMGHCYDLSGEFRRAVDAYGDARRLYADDPLAEARILHERSRMEDRSGRYSRALGWATRARKRLDGIPGDEALQQLARVDAWYATVLQSAGRLDDAVRWCRHAIAEAESSDEPRALAQAHWVLGWADLVLGRPCGPHLRRALAIYEELGDLVGQAQMCLNLGGGLLLEGQWVEAWDVTQRGRDLYLQVGDHASAMICDLNMAEILTEQGRLAEAEPLLREGVRTHRATGDRYALGVSLIGLARVVARAGRCAEALQLLGEARSELQHVGAQGEALEADALAAECHAFLGAGEEALSLATETLARVAALGGASVVMPLLERVKGYSLAQLGRLDEAGSAFAASLENARSRGADFQVALTLMAMWRLARLRGDRPSPEWRTEGGAILARLGVVAVAAPPISTAAVA